MEYRRLGSTGLKVRLHALGSHAASCKLANFRSARSALQPLIWSLSLSATVTLHSYKARRQRSPLNAAPVAKPYPLCIRVCQPCTGPAASACSSVAQLAFCCLSHHS